MRGSIRGLLVFSLVLTLGLAANVFAAQGTPPIPTDVAEQGTLIFSVSGDVYTPIQIVSLDLASEHFQPLTDLLSSNYTPRWSEDGSKIAFTSERDGNPQIYVMDADGKNPQRITHDTTEDRNPVWSPDGKQIAFESDHGNMSAIDVIDAEGKQTPQVLIENALQPAWSPDGKQIAFSSLRDNNPEIYVESVEDGNNSIKRLTFNSAFENSDEDWNPSWSPDGRQIAFESFRTHSWQIYSVDVATLETKCITCSLENFDGGSAPIWSPDGTQIAFISSTGICVMNILGGEPRCIKIENVAQSYLSWKASSSA